MLIPMTIYLIAVALLRVARAGFGNGFWGAWPLVPGLFFGTQFIRLDHFVSAHLHLENNHLTSQNILFAYGLLAVAFFGLTSTSSWLGKGFVLGIGLQLSWAMIQSWRARKTDWIFWPIKREISLSERKWAIGVYLVMFGLLTFLM